MSGRWKYKFETVTAGENSLEVRSLTFGERQRFVQLTRDAKAGRINMTSVPGEILKMAAKATPEELEGIPYDLLEKSVEKVMELSGLGDAAEEPPAPPAPAESAGAEMTGQEKKD